MSARKRSTVYRIRGLPSLWTTRNVDLRGILQKALGTDDEALSIADLSVIPPCYHDDDTSTAILTLDVTPRSLSELDENPLRNWTVEVEETDLNFDRHFHGFTQLYPTAKDEPVLADIIALSGLDGHAYGSWRGKGSLQRMWLRDFLKKDLPKCRTLTYGYNSKLNVRAINTLSDYSAEFLEEMKMIRVTQEEVRRPLILLGHSFGGLIVAQTLIRAKQHDRDKDPMLSALYDSINGIMFFATPHRGLLIDDVLSMVGEDPTHPRASLVENLGHQSQWLVEQLNDFKNLVETRPIVTFIEMQQTRRLVMTDGVWARSGDFVTALTPDSALLRLPDSMEVKIRTDADHSSIVKFDSMYDTTYRRVIKYLREFEVAAGQYLASLIQVSQSIINKASTEDSLQTETDSRLTDFVTQSVKTTSTGSVEEIPASKTSSDINAEGITIIHNPEEEPIADIVLIPGAPGDPWEQWSVDGSRTAHNQSTASIFWPADLLPTMCPSARILVWGYECGSGSEDKNLLDNTSKLLRDLESVRPLGRCLVFAAYSYSGVILEQALVQAEKATVPAIRDIMNHTVSVIFIEEASMQSTKPSFARQSQLYSISAKAFVVGPHRRNNDVGSAAVLEAHATQESPRYSIQEILMEYLNFCRFSSATDPNCQEFGAALDAILSEIKGWDFDLRDDCSRSLHFPELQTRELDIMPSLEGTSTWLFRHETYLAWSKFDDDALRSAKDYSGSKANLEQAMLFNLIQQDRLLFQAFISLYKTKCSTSFGPWAWRLEELQDFCRTSFQAKNSKVRRVLLFIDALDECEDDDEYNTARDLVYYLRDITTESRLKVCLSSRHYPHIKVPDCPEIFVDRLNIADILKFALLRLPTDARGRALAEKVAIRAEGVFLWVILVVKRLSIDLDNERTDHDLDQALDAVPSKLEDLFASLFVSTPSKAELRKAANIFQWILLAARPLSFQELRHALTLREDGVLPIGLAELWYEDKDCLPSDPERFLISLRFYTRGLTESIGNPTKDSLIQFIHETVRAYFSQGPGFSVLEGSVTHVTIAERHAKLAEYCMTCLWPSSSKNRPFLQYAAENLFRHVREAEIGGVVSHKLMAELAKPNARLWKDWIAFVKLSRIDTRGFDGSTPLHLLCTQGLLLSASVLLRRGADVNAKDKVGDSALHEAVRSARKGVVRFLVENKADTGIQNSRGQTPLHCISQCRADKNVMLEEFRPLLNNDCLTKTDRQGRTAVHEALWCDNIPAMHALLEYQPDIRAVHSATDTLLHEAIQRDNISAVSVLLEHKAYIQTTNGRGRTPLYVATRRGQRDIVALLLKAGANPSGQNLSGKTALHAAAELNHVDIMEELLRYDADPNARTASGLTPMHSVVRSAYFNMSPIATLIKAGADCDAVDEAGRTVLHCIIQISGKSFAGVPDNSCIGYFLRLAGTRLDLSQPDAAGRTPLHYATQWPDLGLFRLLVDAGADLTAVDDKGSTPLDIVRRKSWREPMLRTDSCEAFIQMLMAVKED